MDNPFAVIPPSGAEVPVLISVPHCGIRFPGELKGQYDQHLIKKPDDTDWFVDRLYDFAPSLGITMVTAMYSRWVIDLNRDPCDKALYSDGRIITGLCPVTDFLGNDLYLDRRKQVDEKEVRKRLDQYYWPYHSEIERHLGRLKEKFGKVLLWDCHSIRQNVPTIQKEKFPDLILGSSDGRSASEEIIDCALKNLSSGTYQLSHNHPFKGGFITRSYGRPGENVHALQLEMTKINYMDDNELSYDTNRSEKIRSLLRTTLTSVAEIIYPDRRI